MFSTIVSNVFKFICFVMLISVLSCGDDTVCAYDEGAIDPVSFECKDLQLNVGDICDSNGDGVNNGTVNDACECLPNTQGFDCEDLQLNVGDSCDSTGTGAMDGTISDDCQCIPDRVAYDCVDLQLNIGAACDSTDDGALDGTVNDSCECITGFPIIASCPGFIQNGDFEIITGDPNAQTDEDIDLATHWKALWQSGSLADLFDDNTTDFGTGCFTSPTSLTGVFAGMWIENTTNPNGGPLYREGMFNKLTNTINQDTGLYTLSFDYANMSEACASSNDVKVGVYGVYHPLANPLPANPTGISSPSNLDLFGAANTVFLGEVVITSTTTNAWQATIFTIDTSTLTFPTNGINHIMITNSHLPFNDYGKMYLGFDNFCLTN